MSRQTLEPQRYFESIDDDTELLLAAAGRGLDASVPYCPGWTVADVLTHVAEVYEHKVRVMAENAWPSPWPPEHLQGREPVSRLVDAKAHLFEEFAQHQITEETTTFSAGDTTIGFWVRRMALEIAVHRYDGEVAHGSPARIDVDMALDGIDEVLEVMLGGPWWETRVTTRHPVNALVAVESAGNRWLCRVDATRVTITDETTDDAPPAASVSGDPESVFLWLWGRVPDQAVTLRGDAAVSAEFRARLVECTG